MKYTDFFVEGPVKGKARPRVTMRGGFTRAYTPKETVDYEKRIAEAYKAAGGEKFDADTPVHMIIVAYYAPPVSYSKPKREAFFNQLPTKKPDADNIVKAVMDALNGVAYDDDKQVTDIMIHKRPSHSAGLKVVVSDGSR